MNLIFDRNIADNYHSESQTARVLTENWVSRNMYCPRCGNLNIKSFENNRPVADFFCPACKNEYELKSKNGSFGHKITDGSYEKMISRITSNNNPDFFFMSYSKTDYKVRDFIFVPKYFFVPEIIEKRKPLPKAARRAGWVGCNILIDKIPKQGQIKIISEYNISDISAVLENVKRIESLKIDNIRNRSWLIDILQCINGFPEEEFTLDEMYSFEAHLQERHPENHHIREKIRQQLQFLRDKNRIIFLGNGRYRKVL